MQEKTKSKARTLSPLTASLALGAVVGAVVGSVLYHAPLCHRPSMFLDDAERQYCDIRDSADVGARGYGFPGDGKRTGLDLRLADASGYQVLFVAGQHQAEETGRRVALMLGTNGGYLDSHGQYVGANGQWSLAAAHLDDSAAREADSGTVVFLVKKPTQK
jgi:hypothetical protein